MLRWLVMVVVVLNVGFLAWSQHWLAPLGLEPQPDGEPQRMLRQLNPEIMQLRADVPANVPAPPSAPQTQED